MPVVTGVLVASSAWSSDFLNSLGGVGYTIPDGPNQLRPLPGSNLNEIIIEFSENVKVTEGDLVLTGVNALSYGFSAFSYDAVAHRATWIINQNLSRDKLLVDLDGSTANAVVDMTGNRLDGDWVNPTWSPPSAPVGGDAWPSGDGTAGGDFQFRINVLPGNVNQDGTVSVQDLAILAANYRKNLTGWANADLNGDGVVDVMDLAVLAANYRLGLPVSEPVPPALALPVGQPAKSLAAAVPVVLSSSTTSGSAHIQATASRLGKVTSAHRHVFHLMGDVEDDGAVGSRKGDSHVITSSPIRCLLAGILLFAVVAASPSVALAVAWKIMPMGDSITGGYPVPGGWELPLKTKLDAAGYSTAFVGSNPMDGMPGSYQEGHGGYTISQINALPAAGRISAYQPDVTLLMIGTNDIFAGASRFTMASDLDTLITNIEGVTLNNGNKTKLIVANLTPRSTPAADAYIVGYNELVPGVVASHKGEPVTLVDMHSALNPDTDLYDSVHPNAAGYGKMANVWFDGVEAVLPTSMPEPGTLVLLATGGFGFLAYAWRKWR